MDEQLISDNTHAAPAVPTTRTRYSAAQLLDLVNGEEISRLRQANPAKFAAQMSPGDTVAVGVQVVEGDKTRVQTYEGVVIAIRRRGINSAFIVRRTSNGVSTERTFQLYSPLINSIVVKRRADVRRAKLYYLRDRSGRSARIREKIIKKQPQAARAEVPSGA